MAMVMVSAPSNDKPRWMPARKRARISVVSNTPEARKLAVEVLWRGPVARILDVGQAAKQLHLPEGGGFRNGAVGPRPREFAPEVEGDIVGRRPLVRVDERGHGPVESQLVEPGQRVGQGARVDHRWSPRAGGGVASRSSRPGPARSASRC